MQDSIADTCLANQAFLEIPQLIELGELTQNTIILLCLPMSFLIQCKSQRFLS